MHKARAQPGTARATDNKTIKLRRNAMKVKEFVTVLNRISENFTELAKLMQESLGTEKKEQPAKKTESKEAAVAKEETAGTPAAETAEEIGFEEIRSTLAEKAAGGCRQQVKNLLKEYSLSCLSDIEAHPELFPEIMEKARAM